jgi:hypothetical protein
MKRWLIQIVIALLIFVSGAIGGAVWKSRRQQPTQPSPPQRVDELERPLTKENVSQSLQSHSFRTDKIRRNTEDDVVWRWLKESIAKYPQNWVKLNITDKETYGIVLYPPKTLSSMELSARNKELTEMGLPHVIEGKRYQPIEIYQGNIICPNWSGLIDVDEPKLVYFAGQSG